MRTADCTADGVTYIRQTLRTPIRAPGLTRTAPPVQITHFIKQIIEIMQSYTLWIVISALFLALFAVFSYRERNSQLGSAPQWLEWQLAGVKEDLSLIMNRTNQRLKSLEETLWYANEEKRDRQARHRNWKHSASAFAKLYWYAKIAELNTVKDKLAASQRETEALRILLDAGLQNNERFLGLHDATTQTPFADIHENNERSIVLRNASTQTSREHLRALEYKLLAVISDKNYFITLAGVLSKQIEDLKAHVKYLEETALGMHTQSYARGFRVNFGERGIARPLFSGRSPTGRTFEPEDNNPWPVRLRHRGSRISKKRASQMMTPPSRYD